MDDLCTSRELLAAARSANRPGSRVPHTVVVLPSYSLSESMLARFGDRLPALEHRQLLSLLDLPRVPGAQVIFVTSQHPTRRVLDYYLSLVPAEHRPSMRARVRIVEVPDLGARSVTAKLLDRPDIVAHIRERTQGRLAYIEPWNVTTLETELARQLRLPLNGTPPELWSLGFKSGGRAILRSAGVPVPFGRENVRTVDGVVAAAEAVRARNRRTPGVVIKTDNGATGNGNRVLRFADLPGPEELRAAVQALEPEYLAELAAGGVVEELVSGSRFASPSVQLDIAPDGRVEVLSTHEQDMGGPIGQLYLGCRFPAQQAYSTALAEHGEAVARVLAERGAVGRVSVDFAAVESGPGAWDLYGLEINLRTSGTNHPLALLRALTPGRYDVTEGAWLTDDGATRCYRSSDNLVDPGWRGRQPREVISTIRSAGLEFHRERRTGVVLHMFAGLGIDGRLGLTAIGGSPAHAALLFEAATTVLSAPAERTVPLPA